MNVSQILIELEKANGSVCPIRAVQLQDDDGVTLVEFRDLPTMEAGDSIKLPLTLSISP